MLLNLAARLHRLVALVCHLEVALAGWSRAQEEFVLAADIGEALEHAHF